MSYITMKPCTPRRTGSTNTKRIPITPTILSIPSLSSNRQCKELRLFTTRPTMVVMVEATVEAIEVTGEAIEVMVEAMVTVEDTLTDTAMVEDTLAITLVDTAMAEDTLEDTLANTLVDTATVEDTQEDTVEIIKENRMVIAIITNNVICFIQ